MPDPIQAGFAQYDPGRLWMIATKWKSGSRLVLSGLPETGPLILTHQLASRPDAFRQTLARPSRSDSGRFCTISSVPSFKKSERNWMQDVGSGPVVAACWP